MKDKKKDVGMTAAEIELALQVISTCLRLLYKKAKLKIPDSIDPKVEAKRIFNAIRALPDRQAS
jgi:hypothetical protein